MHICIVYVHTYARAHTHTHTRTHLLSLSLLPLSPSPLSALPRALTQANPFGLVQHPMLGHDLTSSDANSCLTIEMMQRAAQEPEGADTPHPTHSTSTSHTLHPTL